MPNMRFSRREFVKSGAAACSLALAGYSTQAAAPPPIIDCHTHFYDPKRKQGVPWPPREEARLYRQVFPKHLKALAGRLGKGGGKPARLATWLRVVIIVQWAAGALNVALLAPVWMQIVHLLLADLAWIVWVLLGLQAAVPSVQSSTG